MGNQLDRGLVGEGQKSAGSALKDAKLEESIGPEEGAGYEEREPVKNGEEESAYHHRRL